MMKSDHPELIAAGAAAYSLIEAQNQNANNQYQTNAYANNAYAQNNLQATTYANNSYANTAVNTQSVPVNLQNTKSSSSGAKSKRSK